MVETYTKEDTETMQNIRTTLQHIIDTKLPWEQRIFLQELDDDSVFLFSSFLTAKDQNTRQKIIEKIQIKKEQELENLKKILETIKSMKFQIDSLNNSNFELINLKNLKQKDSVTLYKNIETELEDLQLTLSLNKNF